MPADMLTLPVETFYFDSLQFLYHLALAVLVGGALALSVPGAPDDLLARFDRLAIVALLLLAVTSVLKASGFEVAEPRLYARWIALGLLAVATLYGSVWARPVARALRSTTPAFDDLRADAPARRESAKLHGAARRAMRLALSCGLVALFLS